jgi:hypothetical protein
MSDRLLGITADVLRSFGSAFGGRHLAIVGGIVPGLLAPQSPPSADAHVGTADLDLHLSLHLLDGETADYYRAIIDGLRDLGLRPAVQDEKPITWRWIGEYRNTQLMVELLCPTRTRAGRPEKPSADTPAEANIGPSGEISALAVGFGHLVPADTVVVERRVETKRGRLSYEFPVAGLAPWLCLKADAIMRRDKPKDAYDIVWLLDALGPESASALLAASPILAGEHAGELRDQLRRLIEDQFKDVDSVRPVMYADFIQVEPGHLERRHAQGTLAAFGRAILDRHGIQISQ